MQATELQVVNSVVKKEVKICTTQKSADIGLTKVISDLTLKGYVPCIPLSEHQPYDIVAIAKTGTAVKLQMKYASLKHDGTAEVRFRRSWADKNGTHTEYCGRDEFNYYAIYCLEKDAVLYVPNNSACPNAIRFDKPANNQIQNVKWAKDYLKLSRESSETIRCTPEMVKT